MIVGETSSHPGDGPQQDHAYSATGKQSGVLWSVVAAYVAIVALGPHDIAWLALVGVSLSATALLIVILDRDA